MNDIIIKNNDDRTEDQSNVIKYIIYIIINARTFYYLIDDDSESYATETKLSFKADFDSHYYFLKNIRFGHLEMR